MFESSRQTGAPGLGGLPGPALARQVEDLGSRLAGLDDATLVDVMAAATRLTAWAQERAMACMAELAHRRRHEVSAAARDPLIAARCVADEIACATRTSRHHAHLHLSLATTLAQDLPSTRAALHAGRISTQAAQIIADALGEVPAERWGVLERDLLSVAATATPATLRRAARRATLPLAPEVSEALHTRARAQRRVTFTPAEHGMAELWALLPAEAAITAKTALDALARHARTPGDARTLDQRRADALTDTLAHALEHTTGLPSTRLGRPHIIVTVPAALLHDLGSDTGSIGGPQTSSSGTPGSWASAWTSRQRRPGAALDHGTGGPGYSPAELAGYGPIPDSLARDLARDGTWRCAALDDTHHTLAGLGRTTHRPDYRPGPALTRHITLRDHTCRFPGCTHPAATCDTDHTIPHPTGPTCECNTAALCPHHHRLKHETRWTVTAAPHDPDHLQHPPGTLIWTAPTGHTYASPPPALPHTEQPETHPPEPPPVSGPPPDPEPAPPDPEPAPPF